VAVGADFAGVVDAHLAGQPAVAALAAGTAQNGVEIAARAAAAAHRPGHDAGAMVAGRRDRGALADVDGHVAGVAAEPRAAGLARQREVVLAIAAEAAFRLPLDADHAVGRGPQHIRRRARRQRHGYVAGIAAAAAAVVLGRRVAAFAALGHGLDNGAAGPRDTDGDIAGHADIDAAAVAARAAVFRVVMR